MQADGVCVKGQKFGPGRRVGDAMSFMQVYAARNVDELVILDITATREGRDPQFELIGKLCSYANMPVAIGGGIKTLDDARHMFECGADKIVLRDRAHDYDFIKALSKRFGNQAITVAIDVKGGSFNYSCVWDTATKSHMGITGAHHHAIECQRAGAGEILLTSMKREGTFLGYDFNLIKTMSRYLDIPVVAHGGAGHPLHCVEAIKAGAHAVAIGSMFHFTENTPKGVARWLDAEGIPTRLD